MGTQNINFAVQRDTVSASQPQPTPFAFTIDQVDPILIVKIYLNTNNAAALLPSAAAWGASSMTLIAAREGVATSVSVWRLYAPAADTRDVAVTLPALSGRASELVVVAEQYRFAHQSAAIGTFFDDSGDGTTAQNTGGIGATEADLLVVAAAARENHDLSPFTGSVPDMVEWYRLGQGFGADKVNVVGAVQGGRNVFDARMLLGAGGAYDDWAMITFSLLSNEQPTITGETVAVPAFSTTPAGGRIIPGTGVAMLARTRMRNHPSD